MKRWICLLLAAFLALGTISFFASCHKEQRVKIAILQYSSHSSIEQIKNTIQGEIEARAADRVELIFGNAERDDGVLSDLLNNYRNGGVNVVIPIGTKASAAAKDVFGGSGVPVVYAAVNDPAALGLLGNDCTNFTGVGDTISPKSTLSLIKTFFPEIEKLGFLYTEGELNSALMLTIFERDCDDEDIELIPEPVTAEESPADAIAALRDAGAQAIYVPTDNAIAVAMEDYAAAAQALSLPLFGSADSMVSEGALAAVGVDYEVLGKQVAEIVIRLLGGAAPPDIPDERLTGYQKYVNLQVAGVLGVDLPDPLPKDIRVLVDEEGNALSY